VLVPQSEEQPEEKVVNVAPPAKEVASIAVECQLCSSRYYAKPSQLGKMLKCPDCHTENVVKPAVSRHEKPRPVAAPPLKEEDDFKLSEAVDTPQYRALSRDALEFERAIRSSQGLDSEPPPAPTPVVPERGTRPATMRPPLPPPVMDDGVVLLEPMDSKPAAPPPPPVPSDPGEEIVDLTRDEGPPVVPPPPPIQQPAGPAPLPAGLGSPIGADDLEILDHEVPFAGGNTAPPGQTPVPSSQPPPQPVVPNYGTPARPEDMDLFPEDRMPVAPPRPMQPAPPPPVHQQPPQYAHPQDEDAGYAPAAMAPPVSRPEWKPVVRLPKPDARDTSDHGAEVDLKQIKQVLRGILPSESGAPLPPELAKRQPFAASNLSVLWQPIVLGQWIVLAVAVGLELLGLQYVFDSLGGGAGEQIMGVLIFVALIPPVLVTIAFASTVWMTILEETANGNERITRWPEFSSFEWMGGMMFLLAALAIAAVPAAPFLLLLNCAGLPTLLAPFIFYPCVFLVFPPVMLSMIEAATVTAPMSKTMMASFQPLRQFWLQFYLRSFGWGLLGVFAFAFSTILGVFTLIPAALIVTAVPMIYFRLLGRMAMMYRDYVAATTPDEEEDGSAVRHVLQ